MEQLINKNSRIEVVDALRGFAVMAIILVHNLEHFIFPVYPTDSPNWLNILDQGIFNGIKENGVKISAIVSSGV